jgi:hypothetical protein
MRAGVNRERGEVFGACDALCFETRSRTMRGSQVCVKEREVPGCSESDR